MLERLEGPVLKDNNDTIVKKGKKEKKRLERERERRRMRQDS